MVKKESFEKDSSKLKRYFVLPENLLEPEDMKAWVSESIEVVKLSDLKKEIEEFEKEFKKETNYPHEFNYNFNDEDWKKLKQKLVIE